MKKKYVLAMTDNQEEASFFECEESELVNKIKEIMDEDFGEELSELDNYTLYEVTATYKPYISINLKRQNENNYE